MYAKLGKNAREDDGREEARTAECVSFRFWDDCNIELPTDLLKIIHQLRPEMFRN
jgi:hypothetical protein